jgi:hypothetical protein
MMRNIYVGMILCCLVSVGYAGERASSLVNSFQVMCTLEALDFARSDKKAAAMRLVVRKDLRTPPDAAGNFLHSKAWLVPLKTGPHEFTIAEGRGPKGEVKSCGIGAPDVDGDDFRSELVRAMKLGPPISESTSPDGARSTAVWRHAPDGLDLMLTDGSPKAQPGVYLLLVKKPSAK